MFVNVAGLCPTTLRMNLFLVSFKSNYRVRPRARLLDLTANISRAYQKDYDNPSTEVIAR